ncbi:ABC transporter permease [Vibrio lamellibrachiae]|uniref:ABC transporter permease n=1 Tax=Vibrio lamellibrachiae TaxID=2910253 RepID=UPI003D1040E7
MTSLLQQTWQTLVAHRVKSMLAIIAIAWGVISVVVLIALGEGFYRYQIQQLSFMAKNVQSAYPRSTSKPWQGMPSRRPIHIPQEKVDMITQSGFVEAAVSVYAKMDATVTNDKGQSLTNYVNGISPPHFSMTLQKLELGSRNFTPSDMANHTRVAVLGAHIAQVSEIHIGQKIKVNGIPFGVIGIIKDEDASSMYIDGQIVFIPYTTYLDLWEDKPISLMLKPISGMAEPVFRQGIVTFYAKQLRFDPTDNEALNLPDWSERSALYESIFRGIQLFLGASGAMTMAVGALGVANIMFLSVTERTREIGVRLAIGATQKSILTQFILEGLFLVMVGTVFGLTIAYMTVDLLAFMALPNWLGSPVITPNSIVWSLLVTLVLALLASYFPARRASRLAPVVALSARA